MVKRYAPAGQLGAAGAGGIEADHLDGRVERIDERPQGFQPHADAVAQQQRRPCPGARPDRDAQLPSPPACMICSRTESSLTGMSIPPRARRGCRLCDSGHTATGIVTPLEIVRNRQSLVSMTGFRRVSGEGRAGVSGRGGRRRQADGGGGGGGARGRRSGCRAAGRYAVMPGGPNWRNGCRPQGKPARDVLPATARLLPGNGGAWRRQERRPGQAASPSRRAGPAAGDRSRCPAASRSRSAADLLTIVSRERKARNYGAAVTRYLERADAMPAGAFIRNRRKLARLSLRQLAEMTFSPIPT